MGRIVMEKEGNEHGLYQGRYCSDYNNRTLVKHCSPGTTNDLFRANECYNVADKKYSLYFRRNSAYSH
jgi:hypothetical protein